LNPPTSVTRRGFSVFYQAVTPRNIGPSPIFIVAVDKGGSADSSTQATLTFGVIGGDCYPSTRETGHSI